MRTRWLTACGCTFTIQCGDDQTAALVTAAFGGLLSLSGPATATPVALGRVEMGVGGVCLRGGGPSPRPEYFDDPCDFLLHLDKKITITLQHRRPDLYFVHAAALARHGRVAVIPAPSGTGKSMLTLALLDRGFTLLSDELAPVDVTSGTVHSYARALCLKAALPPPYKVPRGTIESARRSFVPVNGLRTADQRHALPLAALVFLRRNGPAAETCQSITSARAAAQLMANALNPLAHAGNGLDGALTLVQKVPCFDLDSTDLAAACAAVEAILSDPTDDAV